jgi:hypothetical protein
MLFKTNWREIARYRACIAGEAELATQQVPKGSGFRDVMVVMDDEKLAVTSYPRISCLELGRQALPTPRMSREATRQASTGPRLPYLTSAFTQRHGHFR